MLMKTLVCTTELDSSGDCATTAQAWVDLPEPILPALTMEEGLQVAFAIVGVWTLGLIARLYQRALQLETKTNYHN